MKLTILKPFEAFRRYSDSDDEIQRIRERFIHQIFVLFIIIGFFAYIPSVYFAVKHNLLPIVIVDTVAYGSILGIFFSRKFSYFFRVFYFLLIGYLIGMALLFAVRAEYALIWFFAIPVFAAILIGLRAAIVTLLANLFILLASAILIFKGMVFWSIDVGTTDMITGWFIISINFMLLNTIAAVTVAVLLERLYDSIHQQKDSNERLEQQRKELESEIEIRKNAEKENSAMTEKLQQAQKMEAIGMMAGGVAHDLNNILSGIVNYPELMLLKLPDDSPLRKHLEGMKKAGIRAADVVSDLLTVARGAASVKITQDLNVLVGDYLESPEIKQLRLSHPLVELKVKQDKNIALNAECSPIHIQKSLMNLLTNAFESIDKQGIVSIELQKIDIQSSSPQTGNIPVGHYVVLSITDSGNGINDQDIHRIFEPFFTKKVMGRSGTGLGLAIVWNTIQDHNGFIQVGSDEAGTRFQLYLPASLHTPALVLDVELRSALVEGLGETILIVDDDFTQRDIAENLLSSVNYKVTVVSSGEEAIEYLQANKVDLIILDMVMTPGISGLETYRRIQSFNSQQKTLIYSGYSKSEDIREVLQLGAKRFISKPYTHDELCSAVHDVLCL